MILNLFIQIVDHQKMLQTRWCKHLQGQHLTLSLNIIASLVTTWPEITPDNVQPLATGVEYHLGVTS